MLEKDNTKVYVNGEFFLKKEASISVFDRGFLFSDSVYEVTAVIEGKLVDWQEHFARLVRSLDNLDIVNNFNEEDFYKIQKKLINQNIIKDGMIPKVNTAIDAIEKGVRAVVILDGSIQNACLLELFTDHGVGTLIREEID